MLLGILSVGWRLDVGLVVHGWGRWSSVDGLAIDGLAVGLLVGWVGQHDGLVSAGVAHGGLLGQLGVTSFLTFDVNNDSDNDNKGGDAANDDTGNGATSGGCGGGGLGVVVVIVIVAGGVGG